MKKKGIKISLAIILSMVMAFTILPSSVSANQRWTDAEADYADFLFETIMDIQEAIDVFFVIMDTGNASLILVAMAELQVTLNPLIPYVYNSHPIHPRFTQINSYLEQAIVSSQSATTSLNYAYRFGEERFMIDWGRNFDVFLESFVGAREEIRALMNDFAIAEGIIPAPTPSLAPTSDEISVNINGQPVIFDGANPAMIDGRTLVPVRGVFEAMGFYVNWNPDTRTATLTRYGHIVVIALDSNTFTTNGVSHSLEVPAQLINGSTMLPIRAVLESVGYTLGWDDATRTVVITSPDTTPTPTLPIEDIPVAGFIGYPQNPSIPNLGQMFGYVPHDVIINDYNVIVAYGNIAEESFVEWTNGLEASGWIAVDFDISQLASPNHVVTVPGLDPFHIPPWLRNPQQLADLSAFFIAQVDDGEILASFILIISYQEIIIIFEH